MKKYYSGSQSSSATSKFCTDRASIRIITILATCISVFVTCRTSRNFFLRFWNDAGDFFQTCWETLLTYVGEEPLTLWVYGPMVIMLVVYWAGGLIFLLMDVTNKPEFLRKYKMRPGTNETVEGRKLFKAVIWTVFNQTILAYPAGRMFLWVMERRGYPPFRQLPTLQGIILDIFLSAIMSEIVFYYSHRFLHLKFLYKHVHKQHHEWQSPISIAAFYCHPFEHFIGNLLTLHFGSMVLGSHIFTVYLYYTIGIIDALNNHCGYHFPFSKSPEFHDFHHAKFNECFGLIGLLDRLHGTDKRFTESVEYRRHSVMLHLVPPRELIPN